MAYTKTAWVNGGAPAISAANLGKIESALENSVGLDTLTDLRALPVPTSIFSARVMGHTSIGDGGGGLFWWNASSADADNNGTIIIPDSTPANGRWIRLFDSVIDVRWFGAIPNDDTKAAANTTAINNAAIAAVRKATLKISGEFTTNGQITIPDGVGIIEGIGMTDSGIKCTNNAVHVLTLEASGDYIHIRNMKVSHTTTGGTGDGIVLTSGSNNVLVEHVQGALCRRAFSAPVVPFVIKFVACRADSSDTGFYVESSGSGTTTVFDQCYATAVRMGFNVTLIKDVLFTQPIMDVTSISEIMIRLSGCATAQMIGGHIEGTATFSGGTVISITSSVTDSILIDGFHCSVDATGLASPWNFVHSNFAGSGNIRVDGVDGTQAVNVQKLKIANSSGDVGRVVFGDSNKWSGISGTDISGVAGQALIRDHQSLIPSVPTNRGTATGVQSGDFLDTGKGSLVNQFFAQQVTSAGTYPTVVVGTDEKSSSGTVKLRFTNISDGLANTGGTFNIDWLAF